jgi:hypothetical protein
MNIICEYCKTEFKNNSSLKYHQKNAKYCLEMQGKKQDKFICNLCEKVLSSKQKLEHHQTICVKNKREINLEIVTQQQEETILKQKIEINNLKEQLQKQEENYKEQLQKQEENHKSQTKVFQEIIEKMGLRAIDKPTTTNNTTNNTTLNITTSIDFNDTDKIKNIINDDFNIDYAVNGQKGLARFVTDKFLTDKDGKLLYICTDPSRQIFKYKDITGEIKKDIEAKKLTNYIVDGGIKQKTLDVANEWYIDEEGKMDINKFNIMLDQQQNIFKMNEDNNSFKKELATLTIK